MKLLKFEKHFAQEFDSSLAIQSEWEIVLWLQQSGQEAKGVFWRKEAQWPCGSLQIPERRLALSLGDVFSIESQVQKSQKLKTRALSEIS